MHDAGGRVVSVIKLDLADGAVQAIHAVKPMRGTDE
jgi:hypothetical protein